MPDTITTAVPQQTPPQDSILHPAQVYFLSRRLPGIVHLVQYDQSLPYLAVELYEGDEPYTVPDGAAVNIRMAKPVPSTKKVYNPAYGISSDRHTVYIQVTSQMTVVAGCTNPVIEVVVDGGIACTCTLRLEIDANPVQESDLIDTDEYKTIQELVDEANAAAQIVQDNEQALQDVHNNLSAIQNAAANAQAAAASAQEAEDAADRAAIESQKALGFRSYYGGQVLPEAETGDLDPSRPMPTPALASVTIKARGDRIQGLDLQGKTTQAGTGDPSPDNIRMISGVGAYDQCVVLDGSEDEEWSWDPNYGTNCRCIIDLSVNAHAYNSLRSDKVITAGVSTSELRVDFNSAQLNRFEVFGTASVFSAISVNSVASWKSYLSTNPLTIWYQSVNYPTHTGPWYTVVELSQDPYRAVGFELAQPLFDGDTLQVNVPSGCDQMVVLDGSEAWIKSGNVSDAYFAQGVLNNANSPINAGSGPKPLSECKAIADHTIVYSPITAWTSLKNYEFSVYNTQIGVRIPGFSTAEEFKSWLVDNPLTVFYRSADFTPHKDIPVVLEKHAMKYLTFTGGTDFNYVWDVSGDYDRLQINPITTGRDWTPVPMCSHFVGGVIRNDNQLNGAGVYLNMAFFRDSNILSDLTSGKQFFAAQHSAGTPVQVVYELSSPAVFAHEAQTLIAEPGEDGTFTVTGENTLSVRLKAFQDGGDAATIEGHTWADILAAIQAAIAPTAQALMEGKTNV